VLAAAEALPRHSALLAAAFELAAHEALRRRDATQPTSNVAQYLAANLGQELLQPPLQPLGVAPGGRRGGIEAAETAASPDDHRPPQTEPPQQLGPGALLWPLCAGVAPASSVGAAAVRLLRRRVAWRGRALRQLRCAAVWRGRPTSLSTANTAGAAMELPVALALSDAAFAAALGALTGDPQAALRECSAAARDDGTAPLAPGEDDSLP